VRSWYEAGAFGLSGMKHVVDAGWTVSCINDGMQTNSPNIDGLWKKLTTDTDESDYEGTVLDSSSKYYYCSWKDKSCPGQFSIGFERVQMLPID